MYYILTNNLEKPKFDLKLCGALLDSKNELVPNIFCSGKSVNVKADMGYSLKIDSRASLSGKLTDRLAIKVHYNSYLFVASEQLQGLLNKVIPAQIETYPFSFTYENETFSNYKIINLLNKIECADYENSEIDFESYDDDDVGEGNIYTIDKLVLIHSLIPEHLNIFLLGRIDEAIIVVHERLKELIDKNGFSGFSFCKPEDFQF
jgi:hypothetical protein